MLVPLPPWRFPNARVLYQPSFVPADAARAAIPSLKETRNDPATRAGARADVGGEAGEDDGEGLLSLVSLFGWTLGGVFVADWAESPVGPYREVAVLAGLVVREGDWLGGIGAWASHIVVTTDEAARSGRELFGLPAVPGSVEFSSSFEDGGGVGAANRVRAAAANVAAALKYAAGTAVPGIAEPAEILGGGSGSSKEGPGPPSAARGGSCVVAWSGEDRVRVDGWNGWNTDGDNRADGGGKDGDGTGGGGISLPSFSGRLPFLAEHAGEEEEEETALAPATEKERSPLLKYPLRLERADSVRLRPPMRTEVDDAAAMSGDLRAVLSTAGAAAGHRRASVVVPIPFCIQADGVLVVAGEPTEIAP